MDVISLGSEELAELSAYLKQHDFNVGTEQLLDAQRLLWRLAERGIAYPAADMAVWLGPVFATTAADLDRFGLLYREWQGERPKPGPGPGGKRDRLRAPLIVAVVVLVGVVAGSGWWWLTHRTKTLDRPQVDVNQPQTAGNSGGKGQAGGGSQTTPLPSVPATMTGTLTGDDGKPVSRAHLLFQGRWADADANGKFTIQGMSQQPVLATSCDYDAVLFPVLATQNLPVQMVRKPRNGCPGGVPPSNNPWPDYRYIRWAAAGTPILAFVAWTGWVLWKRAGLKKWRGISSPDFAQVPVTSTFTSTGTPLFNEAELQRGVQELRRPRAIPMSDIWPERTVAATVENADWFTPVYRARRRSPEYLVLIDRAGKRDQQAHFADELCARLKERSVYAAIFHFNRDPRTCMDPANGRRVPLSELAARFGHCEVWLVADAAGFFSGFTGRMERWLEMFHMWPSRLLLTPAAATEWGDHEHRLAEFGFQIVPASPRGLARILDCTAGETDTDWYPALLQNQPYRWTRQEPPPALEVARLLTELRLYLDTEEFRWLSASAVYPVIEWPLTLYLGESLCARGGVLEPSLRRLVRLPWFRQGTMPDWLRKALIRAMGKPFRRKVHVLLEDLLSRQSPGMAPASGALKRTALEVVLRREHTRGVEQDEVLLTFLWGAEPGGLVQPVSALRRLLFRKGWAWLALPAGAFLVAAALAAVIWWSMGQGSSVPVQQTLANIALDVAVSQFHNPAYFAINYTGVHDPKGPSAAFPLWCYNVAEVVLGLPHDTGTDLGQRRDDGGISVTGKSWGIIADASNALVFDGERVIASQLTTESTFQQVRIDLGITPSKFLPASPVMVNPKDELAYVWIAPGSFMMGCSPGDDECSSDEKPPKSVNIANGFWLGQTEVTQAAWKKVKGNNPSYFKSDQLPVENVSWDDAVGYCKAIGGRLPTEQEWEYAARAGTTGARYGALDSVAWYDKNSGGTTHPVGLKQANAFGLYDMLGNVWEWTDSNYDNKTKVLRGGSWVFSPQDVRASYRYGVGAAGRLLGIGFRCAGELR